MTLPSEELNALKWARHFLHDLLDPKRTPRVPQSIRKTAYRVVKHFPYDFLLDELWKKRILEGEPWVQKGRTSGS